MNTLILCLFLPHHSPHYPHSLNFVLLGHSFTMKYMEVLLGLVGINTKEMKMDGISALDQGRV